MPFLGACPSYLLLHDQPPQNLAFIKATIYDNCSYSCELMGLGWVVLTEGFSSGFSQMSLGLQFSEGSVGLGV